MTSDAPRVHDLILVPTADLVLAAAGACGPPGWLDLTSDAPLWVVVRRAAAVTGTVAVGIRGAARNERCAATVSADDILDHVPPTLIPRGRGGSSPAIAALGSISSVTDRCWPDAWGPAGSVGYELVSGHPVVNASSDLDLVLYADIPLDRAITADVLQELRTRAGAVRIDLVVETPAGGFVVDEWLGGPSPEVVLRTANGPVLTGDPWRVE